MVKRAHQSLVVDVWFGYVDILLQCCRGPHIVSGLQFVSISAHVDSYEILFVERKGYNTSQILVQFCGNIAGKTKRFF